MGAETPALVVEGDELTADLWNSLIKFVLANRLNIGASSGLEGERSPGGISLRVASRLTDGASAIFRLTTTASPASGATYSSNGRGILQMDGGTTLGDATTDTTVLKNYHDKTFTAGSARFVKCDYIIGSWWITDVSSCSFVS